MVLFEGRVLITDCGDKDDRDAVIASILNHKSSRAILFVMVMDFKDIPILREKFPTVLPFLLIPDKNINITRKLLKFLPHMDHFVNFLGQDLALEFLDRRSDFRIKQISLAYARSYVVDKMLNWKGQGIIFNVDTSDNCQDDVIAVGIAAKKSVQNGLKKVLSCRAGTSSSDESRPLLTKEKDVYSSQQERVIGHNTGNDDSSRTSNGFWSFLISLFFFLCPCINDTRVKLPVERYPPDFDMRIVEAFEQLYKSLLIKWFEQLEEAQHLKQESLQRLQNEKDILVKKEVVRLMSDKKDVSSTMSKYNYALARMNVRANITMAKKRINDEYIRKLDELHIEQYDVIVEEQIKMLMSFWKKVRLT